DKQKAIKERFRTWIFAEPDRTERLVRFYNETVAGHCHYATAIHGHTGGVYRSKRKSSGISCPPFHQ
ncbi:hypothetical protein, partial [Glutamicibacter sp.]|uniref:hypothetical protein n=1 Tax=Glutamicibacter sp. TaxID=1931995 RepID=UPI002B471CAA